MQTINIAAVASKLTKLNSVCAVQGGVNAVAINFEFSEDWDNTLRTVVFDHLSLANPIHVYIADADFCLIPSDVMQLSGAIQMWLS